MPPSFDLLTRTWIPTRVNDRSELVSLRELFARAHEITDVEISLPPAASAFWRVLYVLTARVTGLDDPDLSLDEWNDRRGALWARGSEGFDPAAAGAYFDRYRDRFDLFDADRPWLQDPRLAEQCGKSSGLNKLVLGRPAGQNQVWFVHQTNGDPEPIPSGEAVWYLLAQLFYGPSGRCTSRTVCGMTEANTAAGPLRGTLSFHPVGASVFESLLAGLSHPGESDDDGVDVCPWEADELFDPLANPVVPSGAATLVGRAQHSVLLQPAPDGRSVTDAWITWAWRSKSLSPEDPHLIFQTSKEGNTYARPAKAERALFRDLDALLCHDAGDQGVHRPLIVDSIQELGDKTVARLRLRAFGFDQDGQTRDRQWFTATTPPVLDLLEERRPEAAAAISRWRRAAEAAGRNLELALRMAWSAASSPGEFDPKHPDGPWPALGASHYWPDVERRFWQLIDAGDFDVVGSPFVSAAFRAYERVTGGYESRPRFAQAIASARSVVVTGRPKKSARDKETA